MEAESVIEYWLGDDDEDRSDLWWSKDAQVDAEIRHRFGTLHRRAAAGELDEWCGNARGSLALVIVLDQFSRNIYRETTRAFACDKSALEVARMAIDRGFDEQLTTTQRLFLYMPLMHSEALDAHDLGIDRFERTYTDASEACKPLCASFCEYAREHRDIVAKFGRYPHRNAILGRQSTAQEIAFLERPGSSF